VLRFNDGTYAFRFFCVGGARTRLADGTLEVQGAHDGFRAWDNARFRRRFLAAEGYEI
jgi:hypothetical protein